MPLYTLTKKFNWYLDSMCGPLWYFTSNSFGLKVVNYIYQKKNTIQYLVWKYIEIPSIKRNRVGA